MKFTLLFLLLSFTVSAQNAFEISFGEMATDDRAYNLVEAADGTYLVAGTNTIFGSNNRDFTVARVDEFGQIIWTRTYGGPGDEFGIPVALYPLADNGFMLGGTANWNGPAKSGKAIIIRCDAAGNIIWQHQLDCPSPDQGSHIKDIQQLSGGDIVFAYTNGCSFGNADFGLSRFTLAGLEVWTRVYGMAGNDHFSDIHELPNGHLLVLGSSQQIVMGPDRAPVLMLVNAINGMQLNANYYTRPGGRDGNPGAFKRHANGDFYIVGSVNNIFGSSDALVMRIDINANLVWSRYLGTADFNTLIDVEFFPNGDLFLYGYTRTALGDDDLLGIRMTESGNIVWSKTKGDLGNQKIHVTEGAIVQTSKGVYGIIGTVDNFNSGPSTGFYLAQLADIIPEFFCDTIVLSTMDAQLTRVTHAFSQAGPTTIYFSNLISTISSPIRDSLDCECIPEIEVLIENASCPVDTAFFSASAGFLYDWTTDNGTLSCTNCPDPYLVSSVPARVELSYSLDGLCPNDTFFDLVFNPEPEPDLGPDLSICYDDTVLLYPGSFDYYLWSDGSSDTALQIIGSQFTTGTVWVDVSFVDFSKGCEIRDYIYIEVTNDEIEGLKDTNLCEGDTFQVIAQGANDYVWTPNQEISCQNCADPKFYPSQSRYYYLDADTGSNCPLKDSLYIFVEPRPGLDLGPDTTLCYGDSLLLEVSGFTSYLWQDGSTDSSFLIHPMIPSNSWVHLRVTNALGCEGVDSILIIQKYYTEPQLNDQVLCEGDTASVIVPANPNYQWLPQQGISCQSCNNPSFYPDSATTYYLYQYYGQACERVDSIRISPIPNLSPDLGSDTVICPSETILLDPGNFGSYLWQDQSTGPNFLVDPSLHSSGWFYVDVEPSSSCSERDSVYVQILHEPLLAGNQDQLLCTGDSVQFNLSGASSYSFYPRIGLSCYDCPNPWFKGDSSITYQILLDSASKCEVWDSILVEVVPIPNPDLGRDTILCPNNQLSLYPGSFDSYLWQDGSTDSIFIVNSNNDSSGFYTVQVMDAGICMSLDSVYVDIQEYPNVQGLVDTFMCKGDTIGFSLSGANTYDWDPQQAGLSCYNCPNPLVFPDSSRWFYLDLDVGSVCQTRDSVYVQVKPLPLLDLGDDKIICETDSLLFAPGSFAQYLWYDGSSDSTFRFNSATSAWVWVKVWSSSNCLGIDSVYVQVEQVPIISGNAPKQICIGDSLQVQINGANQIIWQPNASLSCTDCNDPIIKPNFTQTLYFQVDSGSRCTYLDSLNITVNPLPNPDLGRDTILCEDESLQLNPGVYSQYSWSNTSQASSLNIAPSIIDSWVWVDVIDGNGCANRDSIWIERVQSPNPEITGDSIICENPVQLFANGTGSDGLLWNTGDTGQVIDVNQSGWYWYSTSERGKCIEVDSFYVEEKTAPALFLDSTDHPICEGDSVYFNFSNLDGEFLINGVLNPKEFYLSKDQAYTFQAVNYCGTDSAEVVLDYIPCYCQAFIPNAFTPNRDGKNELFYPKVYCNTMISYKFRIFDRWGKTVFFSTNPEEKWTGEVQGSEDVKGVYAYTLEILHRDGLSTWTGRVAIVP